MSQQAYQKAMISGFRWNFLNQIISQATTFVIGIILMNLLSPSEFGLIAMATVFTGFLTVFSKSGLGASLVQTLEIRQIDIDTVFWTSVGIGLVLTILIFLASWPIAYLYDEPRLIIIIQVLSVNFLILSFGTTQSNLLQRDLAFAKLFFVNTSAIVLASAIAIYLAYTGWGVWALVVHSLGNTLFNATGMWVTGKYWPSLQFSKLHLQKHLKFGLPYLGSKSLIYWVGNADNLIIGYIMGARVLGLYSRAYALVTIPARRIGLVISTVLFPSLAKLKNDQARLVQILQKMNSILLFFLTPALLFIALGAEPFIMIIAGEEWLPSALLLKYLSFVAIIKVNIQILHNLLISQGKSKLDFKLNLITGISTILGFIAGALINIETLVIIYLIISFLTLILWYFTVAYVFRIQYFDFFKVLVNSIVSCLAVISIWFFLRVHFFFENKWIELSVLGIYVGLTWLVSQFLLRKSETIQNIRVIKKFVTTNGGK